MGHLNKPGDLARQNCPVRERNPEDRGMGGTCSGPARDPENHPRSASLRVDAFTMTCQAGRERG